MHEQRERDSPSPTEIERALVEHGRSAFPCIATNPADILSVVRELEGVDFGSLDAERRADVFIVCACFAGDPHAARALRTRIELAASHLDGVERDEVLQRCWLRLFSEHRRVLRYVGRGDLDGLFRVTATRIAITTLRDARPKESLHSAVELPELAPPPDTTLANEQYARAFKDGLQEAIDALNDEDRLLLRLHLVDRLGIDQLSGLLRVHRATAARRLERVRGRIAQRVTRSLAQALGESGVNDSHLRHLRSQLDLSLSRILAQ